MLSEDQKKIRQWRNERVNKKGIHSQAEYDETVRIKNEIQVGVLRGEHPTPQCTALELQSRMHFGLARAQSLAGKWHQQKRALEGVKSEDFAKTAKELGISESVIKELKHE